MERFQLGHASGAGADCLVDDCLQQLGPVDSSANLGFVYATDALAPELDAVLTRLREATAIPHWTGTVGVGICATGREYYEQPALAVMLAGFPEPALCAVPPLREGVGTFTDSAAAWLRQDAFHFGILHADPGNPASPGLIAELSEATPGAFFVGGLTSSHGENPQVADAVTGGGISGVLFSSEVPVVSGHTQGCTPIGAKHVITSCQHNVLIELDGRPALDVFKQDIGEVMAQDLQRVAGYIFAGIPIRGSDTGDYMVRNLMGIDPEQGLVAIGEIVEPGTEVMFCRRDGNSAREDMLRMLADIRGRLDGRARGAVYYSCLGRGRYQFGANSEELGFIRAELGDIPLVGFFANGEIFHNRLYGYTGVLTVFC
ncbi:MAG: FIST N-terminal domain-containing protein [Gammaproteobacteria bacterium]|nr:FIST N-terminal domain-containing protein [Gammaproteobacteria bacterium]